MKKSRIEPKPKAVEFIKRENTLVTKPGIELSRFAANITDIHDHIVNGRELPDHYYRKSKGRDHLLQEKGWMHLHVGHDIDDNVLLVVEQTADKVIFIGLTDHDIFKESPRAKSLRGLGSEVAAAKLKGSSTPKQTASYKPAATPEIAATPQTKPKSKGG